MARLLKAHHVRCHDERLRATRPGKCQLHSGCAPGAGREDGPFPLGLRLVSDNAGWFVPHEQVCWLSSCPALLRTDHEGRLHCATGPALAYARGLELFAWKGTPVPSWIITQPEALTLAWIDAQIDPRVRHAMIDIFTPQRFVAAGGADRAGSDAAGTLRTRKWTHRGVTIDSWAAIEIAGSFHCVPARFTTAPDAFAWVRRAAYCCCGNWCPAFARRGLPVA